ncbi:hypothetical protein PC118_g17445 [Phytophthora cactorum]|uniref:Uncharacterized protein n=1 Tax=Phytophthora cactorum TaxID=29920 RepID=A0A8T1CB11_9STRA|nr:hypothetical protein PC112_g17581 [Phytophthora cactorum]KAG2808703.1 hypothetical protein PC111_g16376 [Phytophthora cactorum]KAG2886290.1 hypothetical protein PC114_g19335 [Phytophthora cactorum]KAG2916117.1 hypothetical protein PC115_g11145 [Phytophthora cactorum]KAG2969449.1 hypothetical protein PC118_g17445 [Phytophthora cactorum]
MAPLPLVSNTVPASVLSTPPATYSTSAPTVRLVSLDVARLPPDPLRTIGLLPAALLPELPLDKVTSPPTPLDDETPDTRTAPPDPRDDEEPPFMSTDPKDPVYEPGEH